MTGLSERELKVIESMNLPPGKTCGDCQFYRFCNGYFGCPETNVKCDWAPSRFKVRVTPRAEVSRG